MAGSPAAGKHARLGLDHQHPQSVRRNDERSLDNARQSLYGDLGTRFSEWHTGPRSSADAAAPARRGSRAEYRRICFRLPRQPPRGARSGALEGRSAPRSPAHRLPAGSQRGPRRNRRLGHAAAQSLFRRQAPGGVRHVVRQGPRCRPLRRRIQACQCCRLGKIRRRPGHCRRRPRGQVLDPAAPDRARLQGGDDAGPVSGQRPGIP